MRRHKWAWAAVATVAFLAMGIAAPAAAHTDKARNRSVYLALGDSWGYGQGATDPAVDGYAAQLEEELVDVLDCYRGRAAWRRNSCRRLQLVNLARPATDTLPGVTAPLVASEQLPIAVSMLEERNGDHNPRNDVEAITLHVGGNDVSGPIQDACIGGFTTECATTFVMEMMEFEADLDNVVGQLRAAAGEDTPIVLGTYDNPVPYCNLAPIPGAIELGAMLLEGTPDGSLDGLHDVVRRVAATHDADVAEVFGLLGEGDFVGGDDCLHPTDTGYDHATEAFLAVLDD